MGIETRDWWVGEVVHQSGWSFNPIVVALLYNNNGMATWCWEAAHALHELGQNVILATSSDATLPGIPAVQVLRIRFAGSQLSQVHGMAKAVTYLNRLFKVEPDGTLLQIHSCLADRGIRPVAYILNQSSLVDSSVRCRQIVAAWSYPVSLISYLRKIPCLVPGRSAKAVLRTTLSALAWWRSDWRAYRIADRVLPVTETLLKSLSRRSVNCNLAYPGTRVSAVPPRKGTEIRILMAAVRLSEPRKRILWMLEAMRDLKSISGLVLQLVGEPDDLVKRAASQLNFPVKFLGHLKREELQQTMLLAHVFCFGSLLDDWGYVLVEAMANGLIPIAPASTPFDEIMGGAGYSYSPKKKEEFVRALDLCVLGPLDDKSSEAWQRAEYLFSRPAFGRSILASLAECR